MRSALRILTLLFVAIPLLADDARLVRSSRLCSCDVIPADVNGDGLDDLLEVRRVRFNVGGRFAPAVRTTGIRTRDEIADVGDLNGDRFADLVVFERAIQDPAGAHVDDGPPRILLGNGLGGFAETPLPQASLGAALRVLDFNGDAILDLVLADAERLHLLRGNGDATFVLVQSLDVAAQRRMFYEPDGRSVAAGDLNRDGLTDVVVAASRFLHFSIGQADGSFVAGRTRFIGVTPQSLEIADVNSDQRLDLVIDDVSDLGAGLTVLFGDGDGAFPLVSRVRVASAGTVVGDFFEGGALEIARAQSDGSVAIFSAVGEQLRELTRFTSEKVVSTTIRDADFDADGRRDLLFSVRTQPALSVFILETDGAASVARPRRRAVRRGDDAIERVAGEWNLEVTSTCAVALPATWSLSREGMFVDVNGDPAALAAYVPGDETLVLNLTIETGETRPRVLTGALTVLDGRLRGSLLEAKSPCGMSARHTITATRGAGE